MKEIKQIIDDKDDASSSEGPLTSEAPLDMVETDFSVQNAALEKNSALNTKDIVIFIQFGLVAVLSAVVAYQYKGI